MGDRVRGGEMYQANVLCKKTGVIYGKKTGGDLLALTPVKAIRAKCLDCSEGSSKEVKLCPVTACPLYPYRNGHRPPKVQNQDDCIEVNLKQM